MQEGADISQCPGVRRCVSPTGSLLVDWTLKPNAPGNRNQRTDTLEAFVGPRSDSRLTISGYGPASDVKLWCNNPRRQSTSQVTFLPVQPQDISPYWKLTNLSKMKPSRQCSCLSCPTQRLFTARLALLMQRPGRTAL